MPGCTTMSSCSMPCAQRKQTPRGKSEKEELRKQLEYSEFSFGYAFTENLVRSSASGLSSAPRFPNLVEEGGLGFDVKIEEGGVPTFFQFKLPERMVRGTAAEISTHGLDLEGLPVPFFRMYLMKKDSSQQHELLIDLEDRYTNSVFYAAPFLVGRSAFNSAYAAVSVHEQSVLFSPREIGRLPQGKPHVVAFHPRRSRAWVCSEPKRIKARRIGSVTEERGRVAQEGRGRRVADVAREVTESVLSVRGGELAGLASTVRSRVRERRRRRAFDTPEAGEVAEAVEELLVAQELARVGLGVEFLLAQPRD